MKKEFRIINPIIFAVLLFISFTASAINEAPESSETESNAYPLYSAWHNTAKADKIQQDVKTVLDENIKLHNHSRLYNLIMVEDKIESKYESIHYWSLRYFKYDVDIYDLFGVQISD